MPKKKPLRVATWNINSVRLRIENVVRFLAEERPDVLCLQEIKATADAFPAKAIAALGYEHQAVNGQPGYHGVATIARIPFASTAVHGFCGKGDARHVAVTFAGGLELHNFYVPSGGDIPDPRVNEKFAHKLAFLKEMERFFARMKGKGSALRIAVGDFNVAPLEHDVWSHKALLDVVSHTPVEVDHLQAVAASHDWRDATRLAVPADQKIYSWWSYRARDWEASDRGRRLDHIWLSPALAPALEDHRIVKEARGWLQPSDHAPVTITLGVSGA